MIATVAESWPSVVSDWEVRQAFSFPSCTIWHLLSICYPANVIAYWEDKASVYPLRHWVSSVSGYGFVMLHSFLLWQRSWHMSWHKNVFSDPQKDNSPSTWMSTCTQTTQASYTKTHTTSAHSPPQHTPYNTHTYTCTLHITYNPQHILTHPPHIHTYHTDTYPPPPPHIAQCCSSKACNITEEQELFLLHC